MADKNACAFNFKTNSRPDDYQEGLNSTSESRNNQTGNDANQLQLLKLYLKNDTN